MDISDNILAVLVIFIVFGAIFMTYFVKIARRLAKLIDGLRHEIERRVDSD